MAKNIIHFPMLPQIALSKEEVEKVFELLFSTKNSVTNSKKEIAEK